LFYSGAQFVLRQFVVAAADMRQAAGDHAFVVPAAAYDAQPLVVEQRAIAALVLFAAEHAAIAPAFAAWRAANTPISKAVRQ